MELSKEQLLVLRLQPVKFVELMLGAEPREHQAEILNSVAQGQRRVSVRSGRQVGKTAVLAWLSIWFEMTRADAKTVVTAPASSQLSDAFVPEFKKWIARLPASLADRWDVKMERMDYRLIERQPFENFVTIRTARKDSPESLQGINAEGGTLVLVDEAAGVDDTLFESLSGSMANDNSVMVLTGNPNRNTGYFHSTHTVLKDQWHTLHVNSEKVPSVSREWLEEMQVKYGAGSNAYRIHVLGEFPTADDDTVIARELIESAVERDVGLTRSEPKLWGVDVARFGDDKSVLVERQGNTVSRVRLWDDLDTMQLAAQIKSEWDLLTFDTRPDMILVDVIGIGAGVLDRLREMGLPARGVNVAESPALAKSSYVKLKDELWDKCRAWFERRDCRIPRDTHLVEELALVKKDYSPAGKMRVESKKELKRRGERSPDRADALVLTFAHTAAKALYGSAGKARKPLRRKVKGVV